MSMTRHSSRRASRLSRVSSQACVQGLGDLIRSARLTDDRPLEEIAPLAGLTQPEWERIEAGQAPDTWEQIRLIAAVLYLGRSWMPYLRDRWVGASRGPSPLNS